MDRDLNYPTQAKQNCIARERSWRLATGQSRRIFLFTATNVFVLDPSLDTKRQLGCNLDIRLVQTMIKSRVCVGKYFCSIYLVFVVVVIKCTSPRSSSFQLPVRMLHAATWLNPMYIYLNCKYIVFQVELKCQLAWVCYLNNARVGATTGRPYHRCG